MEADIDVHEKKCSNFKADKVIFRGFVHVLFVFVVVVVCLLLSFGTFFLFWFSLFDKFITELKLR